MISSDPPSTEPRTGPASIRLGTGTSTALQAPPPSGQALKDLKSDVKRAWMTIVYTLGLVWGIGVLNALTGGLLNNFGITPRTLWGLPGILLWPLLHGGFLHLLGNTIAFLTVGVAVLMRNERHFWVTTAMGTIVGGSLVWLLALGQSTHVGASGVIFAYLGYLFATGWFERRITSMVLSFVSLIIFGGALWGVLPVTPGVSWEGHLFGLFAGVLSAWWLARDGRKRLPAAPG
jgi:membrane associated rhomboid family serine protease